MRVFRFMSNSEFEMYKTGKVLINNNNHREMGFKSDSIGFSMKAKLILNKQFIFYLEL